MWSALIWRCASQKPRERLLWVGAIVRHNYENLGKRVTKSPKVYFTETGLASYLPGIENSKMVARDPLVGNLFENMVVMEAVKARFNLGKDASLFYFREHNKTEIDLIFSHQRNLIPIEIKSSMTWNPGFADNIKKFRRFSDSVGSGYVIYSGETRINAEDASSIPFKQTHDLIVTLGGPSG